MKKPEAEFVRTSAPAGVAAQGAGDASGHVATGHLLWTLTKGESTAEARGWSTAAGFELEVQIWTGARIAGHEDLVMTQAFPSEDALAEAALAKRHQLERAGWTEIIDASAI